MELVSIHGLVPSAAAEEAGISRSTISRWRVAYPNFDQRLTFARSDYRRHRLAIIRNATTKDGRPDCRAAAWELEHAFPEDYCMNPKRRATFQALRDAEDAAHEAMLEEYEADPEKFQNSQPEPTQAAAPTSLVGHASSCPTSLPLHAEPGQPDP